jgi:predicted amidohydrolase
MKLALLQPTLRAFDDAHNMREIDRLVDLVLEDRPGRPRRLSEGDLILLPEHFIGADDPGVYDKFVADLAGRSKCYVVGGSHHRSEAGRRVNLGHVIAPGGAIVSRYEKLRPYSGEATQVQPGNSFGEFTIGGVRIMVLICADFWYSDLIHAARSLPDVILVPALSVSRKPEPTYSNTLWRHLTVSRAYEFGVYVGVSDWSDASVVPGHRTAGATGWADPTQVEAGRLFTPPGPDGTLVVEIDQPSLEEFRQDRRARGFFWR